MPRYEVFCPAAPPAIPADATLRVEAEHWLAALKAGLGRLGVQRPISNVLCDIHPDGSIHVTDPAGGGVFRIHEIRPDRPAPAAPRPAPAPAAPGASSDAALSELFRRVAGLPRDPATALGALLDLALEKVDAEAGSLLALPAGGDALAFRVVRGPRADEVLALRAAVPLGVGLAGFCAREDVCVAVSDVEKDPRFHRAISEAVGYATRSVLCAPASRRGRVHGVLEVLNKRGGRPFGATDLVVAAFLAQRAADVLAAEPR